MQNFIIKSFFVTFFCLTLGMAKAQFTTYEWFNTSWYFPLPAPTDHAPTLFRSGSYCVKPQIMDPLTNEALRNKGYLFFGSGIQDNKWQAPNYGLFNADFERINLSMFNTNQWSWNTMALTLRGFGGIALIAHQGGMYVHQNGIVSIGLNRLYANHTLNGLKVPDVDLPVARALSEKIDDNGYSPSGYQLYVRQGIVSEKVKVANIANWPDYVFQKDYQLLPLSKVEAHIKEKGHLPNVPAAAVIEKEGVELGDMTKRQQEKIEELFLHLIALEKRVQALEAENAALKQPVSTTNK